MRRVWFTLALAGVLALPTVHLGAKSRFAIARSDTAVSLGLDLGSSNLLPYSHSYTTSGDLLVCGFWEYGAGGPFLTGITFNGDAMTAAGSIASTDAGSGKLGLYYLQSPDAGSHNFVATFSASTTATVGICASYTGADTGAMTQPDAYATNTASTASSITVTINPTVADNAWAVLFTRDDGGGGENAGTGSSVLAQYVADTSLSLFDSGALTPAGSHSMQATRTGNANWGGAMMSITPSAGGGSTFPSAIIGVPRGGGIRR